jgi:hypothetical protein
MKKYFLLATTAMVAGIASNAIAAEDHDGETAATLNISATLTKAGSWAMRDVNFGEMTVASAAADDDVLATFTNGEISYAEGKTVLQSGAETGCIGLSSMSEDVTGVSFASTTVDLKDAEENLVAQATNLTVSTKTEMPAGCTRGYVAGEPGYFINGQLVLKDKSAMSTTGATSISGSTIVTLQF